MNQQTHETPTPNGNEPAPQISPEAASAPDNAQAPRCPYAHVTADEVPAELKAKLESKVPPGLPGSRVSRRGALLGGALGALGVGLATGGIGGYAYGARHGHSQAAEMADIMRIQYPFRGPHQSGILTPQQQQMHIAAYTITANTRDSFISLLQDWSRAAENMMAGHLVNPMKVRKDVPPDDTGETMDLGPGALTITFGFGPGAFVDPVLGDRFGIGKHLTPGLAAGIPRMAAEKIDLERSGGDLIVQACGEDPMITLHAIHNLTRIAFGRAALKWSQLGYGRTSSTSTAQKTPRNLFGFKDGTNNLKAESGAELLNENLWIQPTDPGGDVFAGGTYLCTRKIKQMMEVWDELILSEQENIIGREKVSGAPLSGGDEFTTPDFEKMKPDGSGPLIDPDSHVATVSPINNDDHHMLRRGYNYMEGNDKLGRLEGGLFFIAFVRDPQTNFVPILSKMRSDLMTEYLQHIATGLYIIPPGLGDGQTFIGEAMFA